MPIIRVHNAPMRRNLDTGLLRTFVTTAETASMTAAAGLLHLSQGAISQQVKRLEEALGCPLFDRDRQGLRLTRSGEQLLGRARRMLAVNDEIWAEMTAGVTDGQVRFGVPYDLAGTRLTPALKAYAQQFPAVEICLVCGSSPELMEAMSAGRIDLALIEELVGPSAGECLGVEQLVWVGGREGVAHLRRPLPVSMVADTCAFRPAVLSALADHGIGWRTVFESGSLEATAATVRADLAVAAWLACTVPADLAILPPGAGLPTLPRFAVSLHLSQRDAAPAVMGLVRHVRNGLLRHHHAA
jgi:DNA-binding transcriptional LysR family regulator